MRVFGPCLVLLMGMFAGCADQGAAGPAADEVFDDLGGEVTSTTGLIRGVVFDATITPIADARVVIDSLDRETTTNADGAFVIDQLEPGVYFLQVNKLGYGQVQQSAEVVAGVDRPEIVKVQLLPNPSELPQVIPYQFDGFIQCSWVAFAAALAMCSVGEPYVDLGDEFLQRVDVEGYPDFIQGELVWDSTQQLGEALAFSVWDGSTSAPRRVEDVSPLTITGNRTFWENGTGSAKNGSPMVDEGEQMAWRVFAGAHPSTIPPVCLPPTPATNGVCPWGAGVTIEQSFALYTHVFHNWIPQEGWTFVEHGSPVPAGP